MSRQEDTKQLVDEGIGLAEEQLAKHGEFFPYGMVMLADGTTHMVAADNGEEQPESQPLIDLLSAKFR